MRKLREKISHYLSGRGDLLVVRQLENEVKTLVGIKWANTAVLLDIKVSCNMHGVLAAKYLPPSRRTGLN